MTRPRSFGRAILACLCLLSTVACLGGLGPHAVRITRNDYNLAAQSTADQELLLNLVRLRYRDTPYFLQIASLSTNMKFRAGLLGAGLFPSQGPEVGRLEGQFSMEESPTVTYTPLVGDRFVSELLEPVEPEILLLLFHTGWSIERSFRLLVQELNGVANAPTASGPTPELEPVYAEFRRVAELFRILQKRREIALTRGVLGGERKKEEGVPPRIYLRFAPAALVSAEYLELVELLGLQRGRAVFEIVTGVGARDPRRITIVPRSVMSALFYASQGVRVPEEDREAGRVTTTLTREGTPFDWDRLTGSLMRVESGDEPKGAYVAVNYRGSWFSIDDSDLQSKSTFSMLNLVLALQAGEVPTTGPILTLPVAQ